jgi:hypothetical protein
VGGGVNFICKSKHGSGVQSRRTESIEHNRKEMMMGGGTCKRNRHMHTTHV